MSDEDKLAEKLRLQRVQEEADLLVAMDTFGVTDSDLRGAGAIDGAQPTNKEELDAFKEELAKKITQFKLVSGYAGFIEDLVQSLCVTRKYLNVRTSVERYMIYNALICHSGLGRIAKDQKDR